MNDSDREHLSPLSGACTVIPFHIQIISLLFRLDTVIRSRGLLCVSKAGSRNKVKSLAMAISHSLIKMCDFKSCCRKRSCPKSAKANEININNLFLLVNSAFLVKCFQILLCDKENILFVCDVGVYLHVEQGSEIRSDLKRSGDTQTSESTQAHHTTTRNQTLQLFF